MPELKLDLPALPSSEIADLLREAAHTMEVAIRFAGQGIGPTDEELTEWREVMYRLKAAARADREVRSGWRTIESAPKDGTAILLGARGGSWIGKWLAVYTSGYVPENPWSSLMLNHDHMGEKFQKPTHWKPLDAPPTEHHSGDNCMSRWPFPVSKESKGDAPL